MSIDQKERDTLLRFIERNVGIAPMDLDEGVGTVYERVVIDDYFRQLQAKHGIRSVLENPADGVTGVPGMNSLEFARNGATVAMANPSRKMLDQARLVWEQQRLIDAASFTFCEVDQTPFEDDSFDLVWNYCMFERFRDPSALVAEMKRVSRRFVLIMTQNVHNFGTGIHKVYHSACDLEWDHGYDGQMTFGAIRRALLDQGMRLEEEGTVDIPPWMDTWDMPLRGTLKQIMGTVGKKWEWKIATQGSPHNGSVPRVVNFVRAVEHNLPVWFRRYQAHHLYVLASK
jgi:SAM-dependent methyltransferase